MKESLLHIEAIKLRAVKAAHLLLEKVISSCHGEHFEFTQHLLAGEKLILHTEPQIAGQKFHNISH